MSTQRLVRNGSGSDNPLRITVSLLNKIGAARTPGPEDVGPASRCLSTLAEGVAFAMPQLDAASGSQFCSMIETMGQHLTDHEPVDDKLAKIREIIDTFAQYRKNYEQQIRDRQIHWRQLSQYLLRQYMKRIGIDPEKNEVVFLFKELSEITSADDINRWQNRLHQFLHPDGSDESLPDLNLTLKVEDRSTENLNAAGLRGGGSAVEHLRNIMTSGKRCWVVLFRLNALDVISQRFGMEAVEDCLMAVSAFLTNALHSDDVVFHWSDSTLLAVLVGRPNEQILIAELRRILSQHREVTITVDKHPIMLRVPLDYEIHSTQRMRDADDVYKISTASSNSW